jgi:hypothetical protein
MKNLKEFIDRNNSFVEWTKEKYIDINNMSVEDVETIAKRINSAFSPENLFCDGEISRTEAQAKYNNLVKAVKQLETFGIPFTIHEM